MAYFPPLTIKQVIEKIEYNKYLLPAIQREFVWSTKQIELLFDSLMRDYPIGSFLMWKVEGKNKIDHRFYTILKKYREKYSTHCIEVNTNSISDFEAVLDGQQRLTALYIGLNGSYAYKLKNYGWKDNEHSLPTRKLYLCLSKDSINDDNNEDGIKYDFRFLTYEEYNQSEYIWFEVGKILGIDGIFKFNEMLKKNAWDGDEYISDMLSKLFDLVHVKTPIHYYLEEDQDYDKALNIFIRINSGGEKLSYSDLIMSTNITGWNSQTVSAREEFSNLIDEVWNSYGFMIDKDLIIRSYLMIFSEDIKFRITNFTLNNAEEFKENWDQIREAIEEALHLISDFGYVE